MSLNAVYASSLSQTAEFNVVINASGNQPQGITVEENSSGEGLSIDSVLIRHNTVVARRAGS